MARPVRRKRIPDKVMSVQCATCPFRDGPNGRPVDPELVAKITSKLLGASQICHHPRLSGKRETHLCRGARDWQLMIFHRLGFLHEPTDDAWEKRRG